MSYFITNHCQERYTQRIANFENINQLLSQIYNSKDITNIIFDKYPRYILYLYEKYNECNIKILCSDDIIFIAKKRKGTNNKFDVITCYKNGNYDKFGKTSLSRQEIFIRIKLFKTKLKNL